jgi:hypothetical protein
MTFSKPWIGSKRVAFVPLFRSNAAPPDQIPPDWENEIRNRVLFNPRPEVGGADRSLRAWLRTVSWGQADIEDWEHLVLPMQTINQQVVEPWDLDGRPWEGTTLGNWLRRQGVQAAQLVMLGERGAGTSAGFWSRVVMKEINGTWLMELIHTITDFKDLYPFSNDTDPSNRSIGLYDEMSAQTQIHPTAFTKNELGWLDTRFMAHTNINSIAERAVRATVPPISRTVPPWQSTQVFAIRVGDSIPYMIIEARKKTDQFEVGIKGMEDGIPGEGVIVYRVQTHNPTVQDRPGGKLPLYVLTIGADGFPTALKVGQSMVLDNDLNLKVEAEFSDGFHILLSMPLVTVPDVMDSHPRTARGAIERAGLRASHTGCVRESCRVESQDPIGGTQVPKLSIVRYHSFDTQL